MKKAFYVAILALSTLFILAVNSPTQATTESEFYIVDHWKTDEIVVILDRVTGVEYIAYRNGKSGKIQGICPRYNSDGTLYKAD